MISQTPTPLDDQIIIPFENFIDDEYVDMINYQLAHQEAQIFSNKKLYSIKEFIISFHFDNHQIDILTINDWSQTSIGEYKYDFKTIIANQENLLKVVDQKSNPLKTLNENIIIIDDICQNFMKQEFNKTRLQDYFKKHTIFFKQQVQNFILDAISTNQTLRNQKTFKETMDKLKDNFYMIQIEEKIDVLIQSQGLENEQTLMNFYNSIISLQKIQSLFYNQFLTNVTKDLGGVAPNSLFCDPYKIQIEKYVQRRIQQHLTTISYQFNEKLFNMGKILIKNQIQQKKFKLNELQQITLIKIIASMSYDDSHQISIGLELIQFFQNVQSSDNITDRIRIMKQQAIFKTKSLDCLKKELYQATQKWSEIINEEDNLSTLLLIHQKLSNFGITSEQIEFKKFDSSQRLVFIKLQRFLMTQKQNYLNMQFINIIESILSELQQGIWRNFYTKYPPPSISDYKQQENQNLKEKQKIIYYHEDIIFEEIRFKAKILINEFSHSNYILQLLRQSQEEQIKNTMKDFLNDIKDHKKIQNLNPPKEFTLKKISDLSSYSNTITICISGFTSEDEDKKSKWQTMFKDFGSEVIALIWKSGTLKKVFDYSLKSLGGSLALAASGGPLGIMGGILANCIFSNPFDDAFDEAISVGRYLGQIIAEGHLFQCNQLNIIGFSLGTVVIQNILKQIEIYQDNQPRKIINQVILLGGAADIKEFEKLQFSCLNSIVNVYSKNDEILSKLLKLCKYNIKPCGLNPIQNFGRYEQIQNYDMSLVVKGHTMYKPHFKKIFEEVDFENDIKISP